jgi:Raf kinase inhibitor-like YbhB/YbcL family protein
MRIASQSFKNEETIPDKFTPQGKDISPMLEIKDIPKGAKSLVLIIDDPDAPGGVWIHLVLFNIPITSKIEENTSPGTAGLNSYNHTKYSGPCPPYGVHRYFFKIYALDKTLNLEEGSNLEDIKKEMKDHVLDQSQLIGFYSKK